MRFGSYLLFAAVASVALVGSSSAVAADPVITYAPQAGAAALHDQLGQVTLRQAPAATDSRWPTGTRIAKVSGKTFSRLTTNQMVAQLRSAWRDRSTGSRVAVDEIAPAHWSASGAVRLRTAMIRLGRDRRRVTFYAAPSMVERVGRTDPRRRLNPVLGTLIDAMSRGRATYLLTYRGNLQPFPAREMASHPTRWSARWPSGRGSLHLMLGPDGGRGQRDLWNRVRASAAGRAMLARGPAAYGLRTAAAGRGWAREYTRFLASPRGAPPQGDYPVPEPGGLRLQRRGTQTIRVVTTRRGRVVVSMRRHSGGSRRAIKKVKAPGTSTVRIPRDTRPGRYRITAVLQGDGLVDRKTVTVNVRRPRVRLGYTNRRFTLVVPAGVRAVLSVTKNGRRRTLGKVRGPATKRIRLKAGFPKGRYLAMVGTSGAGGQKIRRAVRVR